MKYCVFLILSSITCLLGAAANAVEVDKVKQWVSYLSSDAMQGRANGSQALVDAGAWIASEFNAQGLTVAPGQSDFFQNYPGPDSAQYRNVVGYLAGSDPVLAQQTIILSAHYDHLGTKDGTIYNGADDNASGVTALIGLAQALVKLKPKRSVLFLALSGEELGMLGSRYYVSHPVLPLKQTVLNLNFEMVGHSEGLGKQQFWITGADYSDLLDYLQPLAKNAGWSAGPSPFPDMKLFWRSDNISFAKLAVDEEKRIVYGLPAHSISTWGKEGHYHSPEDDAQAIDVENLTAFINLMAMNIQYLAAHNSVVQWKSNADAKFESWLNYSAP